MTSRPGYIDEPGYRRFATDLRRDIEDHRWSEDEALPRSKVRRRVTPASALGCLGLRWRRFGWVVPLLASEGVLIGGDAIEQRLRTGQRATPSGTPGPKGRP